MATLKLCLMVHIEDTETWENGVSDVTLGNLATAVGNTHGAKISVQFGRKFLDPNYGQGYDCTAPTSMSLVLKYGGNFWSHTHATDGDTLSSTHACVVSAYVNENSLDTMDIGSPMGRSGGCAADGSGDWVSITQARGLLYQNSAVMKNHCNVPITLRPYGFTTDEIDKLYPKGQAPGPIDSDVATMRNRPFFVEKSDEWFAMVNTTRWQSDYADLGSIVMIPAPGKLDLPGLAEGRTAVSGPSPLLTIEDMNAAVTQAYTSYQLMATHQNSICNAWYTHIPYRELNSDSIATLRCFVETLNEVIPDYEWKNMNEIGTMFANDTGI